MPVATLSHRFSFRLPALLVGFGTLAGGCQSSRPSFSFQPVVLCTGAAVPASHAAAGVSAPVAAPVASAAPDPCAAAVATPATVKRAPLLALVPPLAAAPAEILAAVAPAPVVARAHRLLPHRAHAPAEVGLGTTVFGILGLITLPIALLGLLLSGGGLVWGIVAGAAALAILVAYLDPFGG